MVLLGLWKVAGFSNWLGFLVECRFRKWTGLQCPGCGGIRALEALARGEWERAVELNLLLPVTFICVAWCGWNQFWKRPYRVPVMFWVLFSIAYGVIRNVVGW